MIWQRCALWAGFAVRVLSTEIIVPHANEKAYHAHIYVHMHAADLQVFSMG